MDYNSSIHIFGAFQHRTTTFTNNLITKRLSEYIMIEGNYEKLLRYNNSTTFIIFVENTANEMSVNKMEDSIILNHCVKEDPNIIIDYFLCLVEGNVVNNTQNAIDERIQNRQRDDTTSNDPILKNLLPYQIPHVLQLYETMLQQDCVLDASDTGTGKTYVASKVCKEFGLIPFVICPKSVVPSWNKVLKSFGFNSDKIGARP